MWRQCRKIHKNKTNLSYSKNENDLFRSEDFSNENCRRRRHHHTHQSGIQDKRETENLSSLFR